MAKRRVNQSVLCAVLRKLVMLGEESISPDQILGDLSSYQQPATKCKKVILSRDIVTAKSALDQRTDGHQELLDEHLQERHAFRDQVRVGCFDVSKPGQALQHLDQERTRLLRRSIPSGLWQYLDLISARGANNADIAGDLYGPLTIQLGRLEPARGIFITSKGLLVQPCEDTLGHSKPDRSGLCFDDFVELKDREGIHLAVTSGLAA